MAACSLPVQSQCYLLNSSPVSTIDRYEICRQELRAYLDHAADYTRLTTTDDMCAGGGADLVVVDQGHAQGVGVGAQGGGGGGHRHAHRVPPVSRRAGEVGQVPADTDTWAPAPPGHVTSA